MGSGRKGFLMAQLQVTATKSYQLAFVALREGIELAKTRGDAEQLANIALTCMELAGRVESKEEKKQRVGFAHDGDDEE
jgi:hypothetical protein